MLDQDNTETIEVPQQSVPEKELPNQSGGDEKVEVAATEKPKQDAPVPKSRFNEVYAKNKQLERQNAQLVEALSRGQAPSPSQAKAGEVESPPDINTYTDHAQFVRDQAEYYGKQAAKQQFQQLKEADKAQSAQEKEQSEFVAAAQKFNRIPGLADALEATAHIVYPKDHQFLVMGSDFAGDLVKYLAANLEEAENISTMSVPQAAQAIGRIEGMIKASTVNGQAAKVSKMKAPISPVGAGNANTSLEYTPGMPPEKFLAWEQSQRK